MRHASIIEPRGPSLVARARELWQHRHLVPYFGKRFVERRYLRTWLGWIWLPLRPIVDVAARAFVFGGVLSVPSEGIPYLVFLLVGMSAWGLLDETLFWSARSLEVNRSLLRRVYVPRLTMLLGSMSIGIITFLVYVVITAGAIGAYALSDGADYLAFSPRLLLAPIGLGLIVALALSLGLWLSVLGAQARDVRFALRYFTGFWFFLTPIVYPITEIPSGLRFLADFNPATAPIELVKEGVLGVGVVPTQALATTIGFIAVAGVAGLWFFSRAEAAAMDAM